MTTSVPKNPSRRARGDGGVRWNERRQRWIAEQTVGYDSRGKRIVRTGSGKTEAAALRGLRQRVRAYEAGMIRDGYRRGQRAATNPLRSAIAFTRYIAYAVLRCHWSRYTTRPAITTGQTPFEHIRSTIET